jgi:hypothetical protein
MRDAISDQGDQTLSEALPAGRFVTPCGVDGCEGVSRSRGWCMKHYMRWYKYGDPLFVSAREPQGVCKVDGCEGISRSCGLCKPHYRNWLVADKDGTQRPCAVDGCHGVRTSRGLCGKHYRRQYSHGDPTWVRTAKACAVDGCDRAYHARGLCKMHYQRVKRSGGVFPQRYNQSLGDLCKVPDCDGVPRARGWCKKHYNKAHNHDGDVLFVDTRQSHKCKVED